MMQNLISRCLILCTVGSTSKTIIQSALNEKKVWKQSTFGNCTFIYWLLMITFFYCNPSSEKCVGGRHRGREFPPWENSYFVLPLGTKHNGAIQSDISY